MSGVNVLVLSPIDPDSLDRIAAVDTSISVLDASRLFVPVKGAFIGPPDQVSQEKLDGMLARAEVIYGFAPPMNIVARAPKLRWIHAQSAGVERFLIPEIIESSILLTNSRGIHGVQVSETVFMMLLMLTKRAHLFLRQQRERTWQRTTPGVLDSKTLGILGLGILGREVARKGKAFGMKVIALEAADTVQTDDVDRIFPPTQLKDLLSRSDYVVVTLPLTVETRKLIGPEELRAMKKTACLVNVARGGIIDEDALAIALSEGLIAGAGLDVFAAEPLPPDSRLWELPNVIITPHIAGDREDYNVLAVNLFCGNLRRYLDGQPLINVVDKKKGY
jgi:D-2-hydroxyacid dehydrogenase (NADP+)